MLIGIDIGGTKIRVIGSHLGKKIEQQQTFATPTNQRQVLAAIIAATTAVAGRSPIDAIGIASPGPLDKKRGVILEPRNLSWHHLQVVAPLRKHFNCPVALEHDASCGGMAEARMGAGQPFRSFVYITISTGIGTSIIIDKQPLPTPYNSEGGQMIIEPSLESLEGEIGTFEHIASGAAIQKRFGKIAADIHDPQSWEVIAHELALGFYNIVTLINPQALVLAGGVSVHHKRFLPLLKRDLASLPLLYPVPIIVPARFITDAPALGAILVAAQALGD